MKQKTDLKDYNVKDLQDRLQSRKAEYVKIKLDHAVSPVEDTSKIRKMRREIARMHTELRRRETEVQNQN
ncbi:MAG: 50S ribosomal protein L29 [Prevotellaceae bacterium]|jgi:large subunit ribosomal protein L29|nr:50S ribosomal protein L29 [Prevotellaceae bacterium]